MAETGLLGTPVRRAIAQVLGGAVLAAVCYWILTAVAFPHDHSTRDAARTAKMGGAARLLLMLGLGAGLVLVYRGVVRLLLGKVVDRINFNRLTFPGLLYALGFAAALGGALYLMVVVEGIALF